MKGFDFPYIVEFVTDAVAVYGFQISILAVLVFLSLWLTVPHDSACRCIGERPSAPEKQDCASSRIMAWCSGKDSLSEKKKGKDA